jgi:hypothetical protein
VLCLEPRQCGIFRLARASSLPRLMEPDSGMPFGLPPELAIIFTGIPRKALDFPARHLVSGYNRQPEGRSVPPWSGQMAKKKADETDAILTPVHHIARLANSIERLEDALSLFIIAEHGTDEDRATIVRHLRAQYEAFAGKK